MAGGDRVEERSSRKRAAPATIDLVTNAEPAHAGVDQVSTSQLDEAKRIVASTASRYAGVIRGWASSSDGVLGSHQHAIKKGMHAQQRSESDVWDVPYLPIDPKDIGRDYEAIIRVNSQSGKGGVAFLLANEYGLDLPRGLQVDFAQKVQAIADAEGGELSAAELYELFGATYLAVTEPLRAAVVPARRRTRTATG